MQFVAYTMIFLLDFNLSDEFYHYTLVYQKFYSIYMERYLCYQSYEFGFDSLFTCLRLFFDELKFISKLLVHSFPILQLLSKLGLKAVQYSPWYICLYSSMYFFFKKVRLFLNKTFLSNHRMHVWDEPANLEPCTVHGSCYSLLLSLRGVLYLMSENAMLLSKILCL